MCFKYETNDMLSTSWKLFTVGHGEFDLSGAPLNDRMVSCRLTAEFSRVSLTIYSFNPGDNQI